MDTQRILALLMGQTMVEIQENCGVPVIRSDLSSVNAQFAILGV